MRLNTLFVLAAGVCAASGPTAAASEGSAPACQRPVYLTLDTGHMGVADKIAEVLREEKVPVTFFGE